MSKLDLLIVSSGITTLVSSIASSGSVGDARLWEGDNAALYVYNLAGELWESHNGGSTWTNIFPVAPTPSPPPATGKITAITQYQIVVEGSTGSQPDNTIIFVETSTELSSNASIYTQSVSSGSHETGGAWGHSGTTNGVPLNLGTKISDAIEDANGTAGVLIGNARVYTSGQSANDHRIYRSTNMTTNPDEFTTTSDSGLMPTAVAPSGYDIVPGIDITDLEIVTS